MPTEAIKIKVNADELDAKLSKSMKELGAHHDQYGRLLDAEERYIGSLSQANVRMGYYIDSQGKMRDANGRLVEGLSAAEKALRMYIDAHGDVRTAEGEFVRASAQKVEALQREEQQLMKMKEFQALNTAAAMQGLAATAQFAAILGQTGGTVGMVSDEFAKIAVTVGGSVTAIQGAKSALAKLSETAAGAGKNVSFLARAGSLLGSAAAVVGTFLASLAAGKKAGDWIFSPGHGDPAEPIKKRVDAINELTLACRRFGASVENISPDNLFGVSSSAAGTTQADLMSARIAQLDKLAADAEQSGARLARADKRLRDANVAWQQQGALGGMMPSNRWTDAAREYRAADTEMNRAQAAHSADVEALRDAKNQYVAAMKEMVSQDITVDPLKELAKRAEIYADVIERSKSNSLSRARAEEALANVYQKYADSFQVDSKKKLDEALEKAARQFGETSDAFREVSNNLRRAYDEQQLQRSENYIESLRDQMKTPMDRLREEQEKLKEAYHAGAVSFEELAQMNQFLRDKYAEKADRLDEPEKDDWKVEEYRAPQSLSYGSQQLYEFLTRREDSSWRNKLQSDLAEVRSQGEDANEYLRDMRDGILAFRDIGVTA